MCPPDAWLHRFTLVRLLSYPLFLFPLAIRSQAIPASLPTTVLPLLPHLPLVVLVTSRLQLPLCRQRCSLAMTLPNLPLYLSRSPANLTAPFSMTEIPNVRPCLLMGRLTHLSHVSSVARHSPPSSCPRRPWSCCIHVPIPVLAALAARESLDEVEVDAEEDVVRDEVVEREDDVVRDDVVERVVGPEEVVRSEVVERVVGPEEVVVLDEDVSVLLSLVSSLVLLEDVLGLLLGRGLGLSAELVVSVVSEDIDVLVRVLESSVVVSVIALLAELVPVTRSVSGIVVTRSSVMVVTNRPARPRTPH